MENDSASAVVGQQHEAAQQKPSKKKPKNKKPNNVKSSATQSNGRAAVAGGGSEEIVHTPPAESLVVNGLTENMAHKLHIAQNTAMACSKVNGVAISDHVPECTATQNGHHYHHQYNRVAISQETNGDEDVSEHHHQPQHREQTTNGACAILPTAVINNKKSKSSKSNKSKNKSNAAEEHEQELNSTDQISAHSAVATGNGTSKGKNENYKVPQKAENGFNNNYKNSSSNCKNIVDVTKHTHNTSTSKEAAEVGVAAAATTDVTHTKATNQLSAHPAAATSVSACDAVTSSNTANADTSDSTTPTTATAVATIPAQSTETNAKDVDVSVNDEGTGDTAAQAAALAPGLDLSNVHIEYKEYESELQMHDIMRLIQAELSEPYSIYTYRYFIYNWPKLCFLAAHGNEYVGAIVCKLDMHMNVRRGYIAMLAVRKEYRKLKIGTTLVQKAIEAMLADNADEVVLETEMRNVPALRLYENLGFVRDKRLFRYYLNGVDALRLKLWFR